MRNTLVTAILFATLSLNSQVLADTHLEQLLRVGREAFERSDYAAAYQAFSRAWATQKSGRVAGLLGQTEYVTDRCADALPHLELALADPPAQRPADALDIIRGWITSCRARVGAISMPRVGPDADVLVDGIVVERSRVSQRLFLDAGEHVIEIRRNGRITARLKLSVAAGEELSVTPREAARSPLIAAKTLVEKRGSAARVVATSGPPSAGARASGRDAFRSIPGGRAFDSRS